jgi:nucleoside-diphosphate-sugar epimerase
LDVAASHSSAAGRRKMSITSRSLSKHFRAGYRFSEFCIFILRRNANNLKTILLTGATGFLGGSLAASLLARGAKVIAVSRNDSNAQRTKQSVLEAAHGFQLAFPHEAFQRLTVIDAGNGPLADALDAELLRDVEVIWHCAAEMAYSTDKLAQAFRTNVCDTADLYRRVAESAPGCVRFYYVSTAYTAGMLGGETLEALHVGNPCVNSYQVTKWAAEQALSVLHTQGKLPVSIFRPTIVVGHSRTGWARRNGFGVYMFVDAIDAVRKAGFADVTLDLASDARPDLIPVDRLTDDMVGLTLRQDQGRDFEIFQCAGGQHLSTHQIISAIGLVAGVDVNYGTPQKALDRRIDRAVAANRPFANTDWTFSRARLDAALDRTTSPTTPVSEPLLRHLVAWYCTDTNSDDERMKAGVGEALQ